MAGLHRNGWQLSPVFQLNSSKQKLSLLIGKNNSGKTSFIVLFDKFFRNEHTKFNYNDFSLSMRERIEEISLGEELDYNPISIQMTLEISYSESDNLSNLSDFILDLDPNENIVRILCEATIDFISLRNDLSKLKEEKNKIKYIVKNLGNYIKNHYFAYYSPEDINPENRENLVEKTISDLRKLINFQVIHAKRNVSSSESSNSGKTALSEMATSYFNKDNTFSQEAFSSINDTILEMDEILNKEYKIHFKDYFDNVKQFIQDGEGDLNIISDLESKQILSNHSKVVYGNSNNFLPETQNGLGHLNILFLLLQIEIKRKFFEQESRDINLLFIEEPEAHTHPQMQYVFSKKIKDILDSIPNVQAFITSHSSHIVSQCDFKDIRYFNASKENVEIKNFYEELKAKYSADPDYFNFITQYLTLYSSELFFAEKIIFIEGLSERILIPYFIKRIDESKKSDQNYIPLTSRNISILEVGANAKAFRHFLEFLGIQTLIITDFDSTKYNEDSSRWKSCPVINGTNTSNESLKYYLNAPIKKEDETGFSEWFSKLKENSLNSLSDKINVSYQTQEKDYHARSFEDAFININLKQIVDNKEEIAGLKNNNKLTEDRDDYFELTDEVLDKKSDFASSILFLALTKQIEWEIPQYIIDGLNWIS